MLVFRRLPEHLSGLLRIVTVRGKHGGSVRLDHAVKHSLDYSAGNPIIVIGTARLLDLFDVIRFQFRRIEKVSDIEPQRQLLLLSQFVIQVEPFEILARAVHPHQAKLVGLVHSQAQRCQSFFVSRFGRDFRHQIAG